MPVEESIESTLKDFARLATEGPLIDGLMEAAKLRAVSGSRLGFRLYHYGCKPLNPTADDR